MGASDCVGELADGEAFSRLRWMIGRTFELRRDYLAIPIEHLPALVTAMEKSKPELDTRFLRWGLKDPPIRRAPTTDLRYW